MNNYELAFLMKVKRHAEKLDLTKYENISAKNIKFISKNKMKSNVWYRKDLFEIDLNAAFWQVAKDYQIISEEIYLQGKNDKRISKKTRLIALGNLAKRATISEFNGEKYVSISQELPPPTAKLFFYCAWTIAQMMQSVSWLIGENALFYWVDAIFVQGEENKNRIIEQFKMHGFDCKTYKLTGIIQKKNQVIVTSDDHKQKERIFNFYKSKKQ
jgi:hypothetical protein